jgi:hypothetical protein
LAIRGSVIPLVGLQVLLFLLPFEREGKSKNTIYHAAICDRNVTFLLSIIMGRHMFIKGPFVGFSRLLSAHLLIDNLHYAISLSYLTLFLITNITLLSSFLVTSTIAFFSISFQASFLIIM